MTPPRRWSFGLRTMFLAVAIAAIPLGWVAYSINWIRERRFIVANSITSRAIERAAGIKDTARAPGRLWLLGEPGYSRIWICFGPEDDLKRTNTPEEFAKAEELSKWFPEARFVGPCIRTYTDLPSDKREWKCFPRIGSGAAAAHDGLVGRPTH